MNHTGCDQITHFATMTEVCECETVVLRIIKNFGAPMLMIGLVSSPLDNTCLLGRSQNDIKGLCQN